MAGKDGERRVGFEIKLNSETEAVLHSPVFLRSPVLSKLLRYLVDETVSGRGDALKSYAVAVDGLGRPETFDPASDSSARVQMGRLRHALEIYYAQHGPVDELCLYLQPGSYRVRLAKLAVAYPLLYRPLSDVDVRVVPRINASETSVSTEVLAENMRPVATMPEVARQRFKRRHRFLGIGAAAGIALALLVLFGWQQFGEPKTMPFSPILEV